MADQAVHGGRSGLLLVEPVPVDGAAAIKFVDGEEGDAITGQVVKKVRAEGRFNLEVGEIGLDDGSNR